MSEHDQNVSGLRVLWRFRGYVLRYKWHLAGVYVCLIATTGFALVIPRLLGNAIDETLASGLSSQQLVLAGTILNHGPAQGVVRLGTAFPYGRRFSHGIT